MLAYLGQKVNRLERVSGIEPPSLPWQGNIITVIRHPPISLSYVPWVGNAPTASAFSELRSTSELPRHVFVGDIGLEPITSSV